MITDNEIKKALECCFIKENCNECPQRGKKQCLEEASKNALILINRLQAENERLSKITRPLIAEIKAEAMTEFAEELFKIAKIRKPKTEEYHYVLADDIVDLLKEKVGK